jgi:hypothetical protein
MSSYPRIVVSPPSPDSALDIEEDAIIEAEKEPEQQTHALAFFSCLSQRGFFTVPLARCGFLLSSVPHTEHSVDL